MPENSPSLITAPRPRGRPRKHALTPFPRRRRGGQPGNRNAWKHGAFSAARLAVRRAIVDELRGMRRTIAAILARRSQRHGEPSLRHLENSTLRPVPRDAPHFDRSIAIATGAPITKHVARWDRTCTSSAVAAVRRLTDPVRRSDATCAHDGEERPPPDTVLPGPAQLLAQSKFPII